MSASKKMASVSTLPHLPKEIIAEILVKLPAKSLTRFKSVSEFFSSLTADHAFMCLHRSWSLTLPGRASILISIKSQKWNPTGSKTYYTINISEENRGELHANRVRHLDSEPFQHGRLASSSDGLICLCRENGDVVICNVSTRQHISLPRIESHFLFLPCAELGFDSVSKRYKVLLSAIIDADSNMNINSKHWVFTLGVDKLWREINCSFYFYPFSSFTRYYSHTSVHIDGVIYCHNWLTKHIKFGSFDIVAFEVGTENFYRIPFPDEFLLWYYNTDEEQHHYSDSFIRDSALVEVEGGLAVVVVVGKHVEVWTWEKSMEWKRLNSIPIPLEGSIIIRKATLLRFTMNRAGEIVLLCINTEHFSILVCNLKSQVWRKFDVDGVEEFPIQTPWNVNMFNIVDNVFSLE